MTHAFQSTVVIGVDIGTTSVKAAAYDARWVALETVEVEYPLDAPLPDRAEQDSERVLGDVLEALAAVVKATAETATVAGVAFSSAMHGLMALDGSGRPLTPLITFADSRAAEQAERIKRDLDGLAIYRRTGTPIHPMAPLAKLLWFAEHDTETYKAAAMWLSLKELLFLRLFGDAIIDHSIASATGLLNLQTLDWDDAALELVGLSRERLPRPVPTTHVSRGLSDEGVAALGLAPDTPFVIGASDGVLANLGVGAIDPDVVACSVGTSGAVRVTLPEPRTDPEGRVFCYALTEDLWVAGGAINNGGIVLRWLRDEVFPDVASAARREGTDPYDALIALASQAPAGSDGLIMLPYLTGERAPHWSSVPRGVLFGLRRQHRQAHIVRAVLEGVTFQLHWVLRLLEGFGVEPSEIRATGGFAAAPLWRQIMADVFGRPISIAEQVEGSAFGAALLGMKALGLVDSLQVVRDHVRIRIIEEPSQQHASCYAQLQPLFERLYDTLLPEFVAIAEVHKGLPTEP